MITINIFYKETEKETLAKLRLKLLVYFRKKMKEYGGFVKREDIRLWTEDVTVNFLEEKDKNSICTKYREQIYNYDLCKLVIDDLYVKLDKLYVKKEYYILEKSCLHTNTFNKKEFYSCFRKKVMNEYDRQDLDSYYWGVFETKTELKNYIITHLESIIEEYKVQERLIDNIKLELNVESEGW